MNLTQSNKEAKSAYLNNQAEKMLAHYQQINSTERKAIIKQIDSFLKSVSKDEKIFWLKFRLKLTNLNEPKFLLGQTVMTIGAREALAESNQHPIEFLKLHQSGDFGIIGKEDWKENELSIREGFRILSVYRTGRGIKIWVITEADRSSTTLLLPEEY